MNGIGLRACVDIKHNLLGGMRVRSLFTQDARNAQCTQKGIAFWIGGRTMDHYSDQCTSRFAFTNNKKERAQTNTTIVYYTTSVNGVQHRVEKNVRAQNGRTNVRVAIVAVFALYSDASLMGRIDATCRFHQWTQQLEG
ncbi:MAG: hypothetical protein KGO83_01685 [Paenibacillaceae bacterium]|nr:hypothetical protein [Paenibacillaceae bacterium]